MLSQGTALKSRDRDRAGTAAVRLPQFNYAGFCRVCIRQSCTDLGCEITWSGYRWQLCSECGGSGYTDPVAGMPCPGCTEGLMEACEPLAIPPAVSVSPKVLFTAPTVNGRFMGSLSASGF